MPQPPANTALRLPPSTKGELLSVLGALKEQGESPRQEDLLGALLARAVAVVGDEDEMKRLGEEVRAHRAMRWSDTDLNEDPVIRVRRQRNRHGEGDVKTGNAVRDVVLPPRVVTALRDYRRDQLTRGLAGTSEFVFPMNESVVRFALKKILRAADLDNEGITCHSLRHTYASLMIAARVDSVFLSRQLGHATPAITWAIYVHLFDRTNHANDTRSALEEQIGNILASSDEDELGGAADLGERS